MYGKRTKIPKINLLPVCRFIKKDQIEDIDFMDDSINSLVELDEIKITTL